MATRLMTLLVQAVLLSGAVGMSNDHSARGHLLLAFLGGATAGAAIAYLTAPRSGADLRQGIADSYSTKRVEVARIPPALRAAYTAATAAAREAFADSFDHKPAP